ncbi:MAG: DUF92 domain-containing protein [Candidatus Micrarchaeota archaeon]|nr:DUF92 domain-containing protein [Candidatus Micrarchaeota archaeon]
MRFLLLDAVGITSVLLAAFFVFILSGIYAIQNLLIALAFLVIGVGITKYMYEEKKEKGVYEHERSWQNVLSNSLFPLISCGLYFFTQDSKWIMAYVASFAGAMADKFGSELGVLSPNPVSLSNLKPVRQGTSGAISLLGTYLSFIGALIIGLIGYVVYNYNPMNILLIGFFGFIGSISDSIAGVFEEKGFGTKSTSNFICTLVAGILGYLFLSL